MENLPLAIDQSPEIEAARQQLAFVSPDAIEALRNQCEHVLDTEMSRAIDNLGTTDPYEAMFSGAEARNQAKQVVHGQVDSVLESYLDQHIDKDEQPERYGKMLDLLKATSIKGMDHTKWAIGDIDQTTGEHDYQTSGKAQAEKAFEELCREVADESTTEDDDDETEDTAALMEQHKLREAQEKLTEARDKLAELSVKRRSLIRKDSKKAKKLAEEYEHAKEAYDAAYIALGVSSVEMLRASGKTEAEITEQVIVGTVEERKAFAEAEVATLENDNSLFARAARRIAKLKGGLFVTNAAIGAALGYGAKKALTGAALVATVPALPVAIGIGLAAKTTSTLVRSTLGKKVDQHTQVGKRAEQDIAAVSERASKLQPEVANRTDEQLARHSAKLLLESYDERVETDRKRNRNRMIAAAVISGVAAVGGAVVADHIMNQAPTPTGGNTTVIIEKSGNDLSWLKSKEAERFFAWAARFKAENPNLALNGGGGHVNVLADPNAYDGRMFELWNQYFLVHPVN